jgi:hypothetical protein
VQPKRCRPCPRGEGGEDRSELMWLLVSCQNGFCQ